MCVTILLHSNYLKKWALLNFYSQIESPSCTTGGSHCSLRVKKTAKFRFSRGGKKTAEIGCLLSQEARLGCKFSAWSDVREEIDGHKDFNNN